MKTEVIPEEFFGLCSIVKELVNFDSVKFAQIHDQDQLGMIVIQPRSLIAP